VDGPLLEAESKQLLAPFLARVLHRRPYVTLKWAQTADGRIAGPVGRRLQISNPTSAHVVHQLRGRCDAILVGIRTAIADDPLLTAREVPNPRPLLRILLDSQLRLPLQSRLVNTPDRGPVMIFCLVSAIQTKEEAAALQSRGVAVIAVAADPLGGVSVPAVLKELADKPITHLLVEPGPTLAPSFFRENLADRLWLFQSPATVNDATAPAAAKVPPHFIPVGSLDLDGDTLTEYLNTRSPLFFSPAPSPDFLLTKHA
jgi:diaminohydroxyphosphoribosylaminopyrimidine deaminase/5-amino-6-(5-phosphoribosylamino)uracil reductase